MIINHYFFKLYYLSTQILLIFYKN